jgi:hypothetical protein
VDPELLCRAAADVRANARAACVPELHVAGEGGKVREGALALSAAGPARSTRASRSGKEICKWSMDGLDFLVLKISFEKKYQKSVVERFGATTVL